MEADLADAGVQLGDVGGEAGALGLDLVGLVGERDNALVDHLADALRREGLVVDVVEDGGVQLLDAHRETRAVGLVLLPGGAGVVVAHVPGVAAAGDRDPPAARTAPQPRREHAALAHVDGVVAVAALVLVAVLQLSEGGDAGEVLVGDGGVVAVARESVALLHEVAAIRHVRQDVLDVLRAPCPCETVTSDLATRGTHALPGQLLREALLAVLADEVFGEDPLHRLEVGARVVGDGELGAALDLLERVPVGRMPILPEPLFGLRAHPAHHVAGQLLAVTFREPRQDRANQLAEGLVPRVGLSQRDHVDVGFVEGSERFETIEHVPGDARESPDIKPVNALNAHGTPAVAGIALTLRRAEQRLVGGALLGGAPADPFVNKPIRGRNDYAIGGGTAFDLLFLLLDRLVLPGVAAPQVRCSDHGHGGSRGAGST